MQLILDFLRQLRGQYELAGIVMVFLVGLFAYAMTYNFRRMLRERFLPDLLEGETEIDRIHVTGFLSATRTILTDRRVLHLRLAWFFSRRKRFAVALKDVHSVALRRSIPIVLPLLIIFLTAGVKPIVFIVVLWAIDSRSYRVLFDTPFAHMPWTRVLVTARDRSLLPVLTRFHGFSQEAWARVRPHAVPPPGAQDEPSDSVPDTDFRFGWIVWVCVLSTMALAVLQRRLETHVSFDSFVFGPLYLAIPLAVGGYKRRDGFWAALLSFAGLIMVKFPSSGLLGVLVANDGGMPDTMQYAAVLAVLVLMSEFAAAIARGASAKLSVLAALLWIAFVAVYMPSVLLDVGLLARTVLAIGLAMLLTLALPAIEALPLALRANRVST